MKKNHYFVLLLLLASLTSQAKNLRIEYPPFIYQGLGYRSPGHNYSVSVYRGHDLCLLKAVERNDTATIIELQLGTFLWARFDSTVCLRDERGRLYFLRRIEGDYDIHVGQHFTAPKKERYTVRLVFPPLPKRVRTIDLTETEGRGEWGFYGIRVDGKPLPPVTLPKELERKLSAMPEESDTLPVPKVRFGMATIRGHLLEYRPGMINQLCLRIGASSYQIPANGDTVLATVQPSGDFIVQLPLTHITPVDIPLGEPSFHPYSEQNVFFYAEPGRETELYINLREVSRRRCYGNDSISAPLAYVINGPLARLSTEWNQLHPTLIEQEMEYGKQVGLFADSLLKQPFDISAHQLIEPLMDFYTCRANSHEGSSQMRKLLAINDSLMAFDNIFRQLNYLAQERQKQRSKMRPARFSTQEGYMQWVQKWGDSYSDRDSIEMEKINICMRLLQNPRQLLCPSIYDRILRSSQTLPALLPEYIDNEVKTYTLQNLQQSSLTPVDSLGREQELATLPQDYRDYLKFFSKKLEQLIEDNRHCTGYTIHELLPLKLDWQQALKLTDQLMSLTLDSIIAPYRGRPVYLQMWYSEPWMIGARLNRYAVIPMQKRLADNQAAFVFIDGSYNSGKGLRAWRQQIPQLRGEHYTLPQRVFQNIIKQLTDEMTDYIYLVFDAEGRRVYPAITNWEPMPDFDEIERVLSQ